MTKRAVVVGLMLALAPAAGWAAEADVLMAPPSTSTPAPVIVEPDGSARPLNSETAPAPERTPGRVSGEVLTIDRDDIRVKGQGGEEVKLSIDTDLNPGLKAGDKIDATIDQKGHVERLDRLVPR
jgi:hypothetical protein